MTNYLTDDERQAALWALMEWQPSEDDLLREAAANDQIETARREGEHHDSRRKYPRLDSVPDVRLKMTEVMRFYRRVVPENDFGHLEQFVEILNGPGMPLPFDIHDPTQQLGLFGLTADRPHRVHVLRGDYTVDRWLWEERQTRLHCNWMKHGCADHTREHLLFASNQYLIAVPTCFSCKDWLLAGGSLRTPTTRSGGQQIGF